MSESKTTTMYIKNYNKRIKIISKQTKTKNQEREIRKLIGLKKGDDSVIPIICASVF